MLRLLYSFPFYSHQKTKANMPHCCTHRYSSPAGTQLAKAADAGTYSVCTSHVGVRGGAPLEVQELLLPVNINTSWNSPMETWQAWPPSLPTASFTSTHVAMVTAADSSSLPAHRQMRLEARLHGGRQEEKQEGTNTTLVFRRKMCMSCRTQKSGLLSDSDGSNRVQQPLYPFIKPQNLPHLLWKRTTYSFDKYLHHCIQTFQFWGKGKHKTFPKRRWRQGWYRYLCKTPLKILRNLIYKHIDSFYCHFVVEGLYDRSVTVNHGSMRFRVHFKQDKYQGSYDFVSI